MKELIIARHAKSSWKNSALADIERPLNKRGYSDANNMAKFLNQKSSKPDMVLTSPAVRAFTTAMIYSRHQNINFKKFIVLQLLYSGTINDIIKFLRTLPESVNTVLIFGHNPTFTTLANNISDADIDNIPTSGIVSIQFDTDEWNLIAEKKGKVNYFHYPKKEKM